MKISASHSWVCKLASSSRLIQLRNLRRACHRHGKHRSQQMNTTSKLWAHCPRVYNPHGQSSCACHPKTQARQPPHGHPIVAGNAPSKASWGNPQCRFHCAVAGRLAKKGGQSLGRTCKAAGHLCNQCVGLALLHCPLACLMLRCIMTLMPNNGLHRRV